MAVRKEMKEKQQNWNAQQQQLIESAVKPSEVAPLERAQKMTKLIETLKRHGGPLNSPKEIDEFLERYSHLPENKIATTLNHEIRFIRDSNIKFSVPQGCYLYKQRGISNQKRIENLNLLVQQPKAKSTANLDDLRLIYGVDTQPPRPIEATPNTEPPRLTEILPDPTSITHSSSDDWEGSEFMSHGPWPPSVGEHLAIKFEGGIEIVEVTNTIPILECHVFKKDDLKELESLHLFCDSDLVSIPFEKESVIPIRPLIDVVQSFSKQTRSRRKIIYQVENVDVINSFA
jgi:hypothetical protein